MQPHGIVELRKPSRRNATDAAAKSFGRNGSDLLGLRFGVDRETGCRGGPVSLAMNAQRAHVSEVPVRELNQNTAGVLARVKRGEHIDITERGAVVARLVPAQENPLAEMISAGRLHPATLSGPAPRPSGRVKTDHEAGQLLRELRDTERY